MTQATEETGTATDDRNLREPGPLEDLSNLGQELRRLVHDQFQLAGLELRLAAHSLMAMIAAAVCIGALLLLAWAGLMAAFGLTLIRLGLQPAIALLVLTALTAGMALLLRGYIARRSRALGLPATLRSLTSPASANLKADST